MEMYTYLLVVVGLYFLIFTILNCHKIFSDTYKADMIGNKQPLVSVLIPARNEQANIEKCINSFLNQTYKNYEILVLDDNSTDKTRSIVENLVKKNPEKLRLFVGKPLEEGWRGKSFAMKQLTRYAKGDYFLFTDADTIHTEKSIELMMSNIIKNDADMVSGYLTQEVKTFGEKITVPIMYLLTAFAIPLWLNEKLKLPMLATAIGQYIGIKKESFMAIGGYDAIKNITTEDVYLARQMKKAGYKTVFIDFKDAAKCRMYDSYKSCVNGISKNIFDFVGKNNFIMFLFVVAIIGFLFGPTVLLTIELLKHILISTTMDNFLIALIFENLVFFISWFIIFATRKMPLWLSLFYPLIFLNLLYVVLVSWIRGSNGKGYVWKGRVVS
ncbi:MAG: glycosyltransferase [Treponemataceae bacterium]